jgi:TRAP-type uncharacterized transport system substrate-binding protein
VVLQLPGLGTRPNHAVALLLASWLLASPGAATDGAVVIAGGVEGRTYQRYAANLGGMLPGFKVRYRQTAGSSENLDLLVAGEADLGFAQVDVFAARMRSERSRFEKLGIVGRLADECVYIAYRTGGSVTSQEGLQAQVDGRKPKLAVGDPQGGMHATWLLLREIRPAFGAAAISFTGGTLAINHLATGLLDAVGWVTDPRNHDHKLLRAVFANDQLDILELDDPGLAYTLPQGTVVYELKKVSLSGGLARRKISTVCTGSAVFARPGIEPRLMDAVSDVLSLERETILSLD